MKKDYLNLYKKLFFTLPKTTPALKTYAIVDTARDKDMKNHIMLSGLSYVDLWHEEMFELDQERSLYLVELEEKNMYINLLLSQYTESVATYFISPYDIETLQSYYSPFTYVKIEEHQGEYAEAIFGFYDPNILPNYIQTLYNEEKIDEFFTGVALWLSPSTTDETMLYIAYRDKAGEIEDVNLNLSDILEEETPMLNFDDVSLPTLPDLEAYVHEVTIDYRQMQLFDGLQKELFVKVSLHLYQSQGYMNIDTTQLWVDKGLTLLYQAMREGVSDDTGLQHYILLGLLLDKPLATYTFHQEIVRATTQEEKIEYMERLLWEIEKQRSTNAK